MQKRWHELGWATGLGLATFAFHMLTAARGGIFRDELYYLACGQHLGFGYVDHPPLIGYVSWLASSIGGTSLAALRFLPALAAGGTVFVAARIAARLGGGRYAEVLTGIAVAGAPVFVGGFGILSMNAFDVLLWTVAVRILVEILAGGDLRWWLPFGIVAGVGLENKISILFLGFGVVGSLVLTRDWRHFTSRWLWLGGFAAVLLFLPHLLWQVANDWPTLEFIDNATRNKNLPLSPVEFLSAQVLQQNPLALPVWLAGLGFLLFASDGKRFRALGWAYLIILTLMILNRSKAYYLSPVYPVLFAAGAGWISQLGGRRGWGWICPTALVAVSLGAAVLAPLSKPILPVESYVRYAAKLGRAPSTSERKEVGRLPQFFADRQGWRELAETVSTAYRSLPPADREVACVYGQNYGHAGAIDFYRGELELPPAIAGHNSYWLWGPGSCTGEVVIVIDDDRESLERRFAEVEQAAFYTCEDCMPYENDKAIWIARGLRQPLAELWPQVKHFD